MIKYTTFWLLLLSTFAGIQAVFGQEWQHRLHEPGVTYGQVRRAFEKEQQREARRAKWRVFGRSEPTFTEEDDNHYYRWEALMRLRGADQQPYRPDHVAATYEQVKRHYSVSQARQAAGATWKNIGPDVHTNKYNGVGRVDRMAFHPTDANTLYVGSPTGGLWKSTDGGKNWLPVSNDWPVLGVADIAIDPKNPNVVYAATGDRNSAAATCLGIMKSTDGGQTWVNLGLGTLKNPVYRLVIDPANPQRLLAACATDLYVSVNAGQTWTALNFPKQKVNTNYVGITDHIWDIEFKPGDPSVVYATTSQRVLVSADGGNTFKPLNTQLNETFRADAVTRIELAVTPAAPNNVYLLVSGRDLTYGGYYVSTNGGQRFTMPLSGTVPVNSPDKYVDVNGTYYRPTVQNYGNQTHYNLEIAVSPTDANEVYLGMVGFLRTTIAADSVWYARTLNSTVLDGEVSPHVDTHAIGFQPGTNTLYLGNDGGLYRQRQAGNRRFWEALNGGLAITQVYHLTRAPYNQSLLGIANQDNGFYQYVDGKWVSRFVGDGMYMYHHPDDEGVIYCMPARCLSIDRFTKQVGKAELLDNVAPKTTESRSWDTPFLIDEATNRLYIGLQNIWYSDNKGNAWQKLTDFDLKKIPYGLRELAISPSNPNHMIVSHYTQIISVDQAGAVIDDLPCFRSVDGGKTWTQFSKNLKNFLYHPTNPSVIWASWGSKLYQTSNGGQTWQDVTGNLPDLAITRLTYQKNTQNGIYVGSVRGVYYKSLSENRESLTM
jgi:photosystem II stability/assembly factor-like uncharacterized protein